jgi:hypothetical protein
MRRDKLARFLASETDEIRMVTEDPSFDFRIPPLVSLETFSTDAIDFIKTKSFRVLF